MSCTDRVTLGIPQGEGGDPDPTERHPGRLARSVERQLRRIGILWEKGSPA